MRNLASVVVVAVMLVGVGCSGGDSYGPSTPSPVSTVQVLSPNGGEVFTIGSTVEIRWKSTNVDRVNLRVCWVRGEFTSCALIGNSVPAASGSFLWRGAGQMWFQLVAGQAYRLTIEEADTLVSVQAARDDSDGPFYFE